MKIKTKNHFEVRWGQVLVVPVLWIFIFSSCEGLFSDEGADLAARVKYHLTLHDVDGAILEAKEALKRFPHSVDVQKAYLKALCKKGKEAEALMLCKRLVDLNQKGQESRHLLETLAWTALQKGQQSPQLFIRLNALLGSALTNDARAIPAIIKELRSSNAILRSLALKLAAHMGDEPLRREILRLIKDEKVWYVRLTAIETAGQLKMREARPFLEKIVASERKLDEEKALSIMTLASLYEAISRADLLKLVRSKRAGLRQLACQIAIQLESKEFIDDLLPLLADPVPDVRIACLSALGLLEVQRKEKTMPLCQDSVPSVAITAAWLHLRQGDKEVEEVLDRFLEGPSSTARRLAAAAVAASGYGGVKMAKEHLRLSKDPFVRLNLAQGLIGLREDLTMSCLEIATDLEAEVALAGDLPGSRDKNSLWMWDASSHPVFRILAPSRVRHIEHIANYPVIVDRLVRLDLLGLLSMLHYPKALESVKAFLKSGQAQLVGSAAGTLIQELEEEGVEALKLLLHDKEEEVQLEAALILAIWGKESSGIDLLMQAYPQATRERKIQILEALGYSGNSAAIPFLLEVLGEPFQVLRIVAASALIQCLYH
jgi:HEAT repeat protein